MGIESEVEQHTDAADTNRAVLENTVVRYVNIVHVCWLKPENNKRVG